MPHNRRRQLKWQALLHVCHGARLGDRVKIHNQVSVIISQSLKPFFKFVFSPG
jgi:hypothetical protein